MVTDLGYMFIQYSEELRLLRTQWKPGYPLHHLREGLMRVLEIAQKGAVTHVLLNLHDMPDIGVLEQAWISLTWFPKMVTLPLQQVALVMPSRSLYNQMAVDSILWMGQSLIRFDIQFFSDVEDALEWITTESPLLLGVQQEWSQACAPSLPTGSRCHASVMCP